MGKRAKLAPSSRSSRAMARLWLFLCGFVALLSAGASSAAQPERCSIPEEVNNAEIKVNNNNLLNATLRYRCKDGYKRKAGTSSLILCQKDSITNMLHWTQPNIICIRDPALPPLTSSPRQTTLAPRTTSTRRESKTFTPAKQPVTRVPAEITTAPVMASTPSLESPTSQLRTDMPSRGTLATTATENRSSKGPAREITEDPPSRGTTAAQDTSPSQLWTEEPVLETVTAAGDWSTAEPTSVTTGDSTQLSTAATHDTTASTRIMLSSVGLPILIITAVALGCLWRRVHRRQHYRIPMPAIPMRVVESEQRGGTPPPDDDTQGPPHPTEETKMMPSSCATPTG
ncbi:interleukin-15 receptor subunit alpha isoform X2 [Pelodiscus sinensis]|uniref:interleukin-15 receptor subunit alpha isoform X2 n=1 Tax=Pelodiscus sinensis TaxID=13735 RepID=UPI003F6D8E6D